MQCDELWRQQSEGMIPPDFALSFVDNKDNKQWVWLALDADTREIIGVYIGARDEAAARGLWDSLPGVYPRVFGGKLPPETLDVNVQSLTPIFGCDFAAVLPSKRHRAVGKETGKTSYVERLNNTRKTSSVSFSAQNLVQFLRHWRITSVLFGILYTTTTHHYLFSTTVFGISVVGRRLLVEIKESPLLVRLGAIV